MRRLLENFESRKTIIKITNISIVFLMLITFAINGIACGSKQAEDEKLSANKLKVEEKEKLEKEKADKKQAKEQQKKEQEEKVRKQQEEKAKKEQEEKTNREAEQVVNDNNSMVSTTEEKSTVNKGIPKIITRNKSVIVYTSKKDDKYHNDGCKYLKNNKMEITLKSAKKGKLKPCNKCRPPR
ncbi:hypothetical protein SAMN02745163_00951 [Clostridium cavendishii DSM 21758]|uniref:Uncharacterized protein n=1 Tax=Clostridium cavendishii DSM 21758 TaxID=1121302 RepID=A0A1M6EUR6_9CLOT|nr:hypothetical protein [Clostridium cavendishii]SHI89207.1 hypothetical protein SAMN02745163_00951 [Clostridium cavendishii DSM 21758]